MTSVNTLFLLGRPLSPLYNLLMRVRALLYARKIFRVNRFPVPVISVGNLTLGGTGKTPTVQMIVKLLQQRGWRPAVVSRGYGGTANETVNVVSTGKEIRLGAIEAGDEPYLLASSIDNLPVLTGRKRALPCRYACEELECDILILDDGFQHLAVQRDIDIVLFNATTLAGNSRVFPGGELREPINALQRADIFLITGITPDNRERAKAFTTVLHNKFKHAPVFTTETHVAGVFSITGKIAEQNELDQPLFAFSGIAHPERFLASLDEQGITITGRTRFTDHAKYCRKDFEDLIGSAKKSGAAGLITTQKDIVKISGFALDFPIYYLAIAATPSRPFVDFFDEMLAMEC